MKCNYCGELSHRLLNCPNVQKAETTSDGTFVAALGAANWNAKANLNLEKKEASEPVNSENAKENLSSNYSEDDSDMKKSKRKKRALLRKKSSAIFICYTLSFPVISNQNNK